MAKRKPVTEEEEEKVEEAPKKVLLTQEPPEPSSVDAEVKSDDTPGLPEDADDSSMIDTTSAASERPESMSLSELFKTEAVCFNCKSFSPGDYGPRCMNRESPFYTKRVDDNDTCEEFSPSEHVRRK